MTISRYAIKKTDHAISEEVATEQVVELLSYYDIDVARLTDGDESESRALEKALDHLRDAFRSGALEVTRDPQGRLNVVQHLKSGDTLTYAEIGAKHKLAMERYDRNAGYSRIYGFMGALCGLGDAAIKKLSARDLGVVEVLGTVFLNA